MTQKQDALDVLGEEAADLVNELDAATTKAQPEGAIVKADETEAECPTCEAPQPEPEQKAEGDSEGDGEDAKKDDKGSITLEQLQSLLSKLFESFKSNLDERLGPVEAAVEQVVALKAQVEALGASETEKVKAAIDSDTGDWWTQLVRSSVQRREAPVKGGPQEKTDTSDPFYTVFGGLSKKE